MPWESGLPNQSTINRGEGLIPGSIRGVSSGKAVGLGLLRSRSRVCFLVSVRKGGRQTDEAGSQSQHLGHT